MDNKLISMLFAGMLLAPPQTLHAQYRSEVWHPDNGNGTYTNPVLYADYSDPDVVAVGDDFYLTASSFNCIPGLPILHSKDLVNWQIIGYALQEQLPKALFFTPEHVDQKMEELGDIPNVVLTFHSVPNRRWESFDEEFRPYAIRSFARSGFGATLRYKFEEDAGQTITMCRVDPNVEKLFVAKGKIITSMGYDQTNCSMGVFFQVKDSKDFFKKQAAIGNHMPLIYGDFEEQVIELGELLGLEIVRA